MAVEITSSHSGSTVDNASVPTPSRDSIEQCVRINLRAESLLEDGAHVRAKRVLKLDVLFNECNYPWGSRIGQKHHVMTYSIISARWDVRLENCKIEVKDLTSAMEFPLYDTETYSDTTSREFSRSIGAELGAEQNTGFSASGKGKWNRQNKSGESSTISSTDTIANFQINSHTKNDLTLSFNRAGKNLIGALREVSIATISGWGAKSSFTYFGQIVESDLNFEIIDIPFYKIGESRKAYVIRKVCIAEILSQLNRRHIVS